MIYQKPKLPRQFDEHTLTPAFFADACTRALNDIEQENQQRYQIGVKKHEQMLSLAIEVYGGNSNQVAYLRRAGVPKPPSLAAERKRVRKQFEAIQERIRQREYRRSYIERRDATAEQLEAIGYEPGVHFSPTAPITFARKHTVTAPDGTLLPALPPGKTEGDE